MPLSETLVCRSLLFVPGSRADRFAKAVDAGADMVCVDLEDAVGPDDKPAARGETFGFLATQDRTIPIGFRMNSPREADGLKDVLAFLDSAAAPDFLMIPKISGPEEVRWIYDLLGERTPALFPVIESAEGLMQAPEIASSPGVRFMLFGAVDYAADVGCTLEWEALHYARATLVNACARARITLFDVPHLEIDDPQGIESTTRRAIGLGMTARVAIHPKQVDPIHAAFAPSPDEVTRATRIVEAFEASGGGAIRVDGKLIDMPVVITAQRVLRLAQLSA